MSNKRPIQVKLMVSPAEHEQIRKNAKSCGRTVSAYIRESAVNMCVYTYDTSLVTDHTKELSMLRGTINTLAYTIWRRRDYCPADLEYILCKMKEILKSEGLFLQEYLEAKQEVAESITETVRARVDEHLAKLDRNNK